MQTNVRYFHIDNTEHMFYTCYCQYNIKDLSSNGVGTPSDRSLYIVTKQRPWIRVLCDPLNQCFKHTVFFIPFLGNFNMKGMINNGLCN